jgi:hypothetical protein
VSVMQLGNFTIHWGLLVSLLSLLLAVGAVALRARAESGISRRYGDWAMTVIFVVILNEKFGFLWDTPSILWRQPRSLLYMTGTSTEGNILLVLGIIVWTTLYIRKHQLSYPVLIDLLSHSMLTYVAAYGWLYTLNGGQAPGFTPLLQISGFQVSGIPPAETLGCIVLLALLWSRQRRLGTLIDAQIAFVVCGVVGMLGSYAYGDGSTWMYLTVEQWIYSVMLAAGYMVTRSRERGVAHKNAQDEAAMPVEPPASQG